MPGSVISMRGGEKLSQGGRSKYVRRQRKIVFVSFFATPSPSWRYH